MRRPAIRQAPLRPMTPGEFSRGFDHPGIVRVRHHLAYGIGHGFAAWLPEPIKRAIVRVWNGASCLLFGHDIFGPYPETIEASEDGKQYVSRAIPKTCCACSREWPSV